MIAIYETQELATQEQRHCFADSVAKELFGTTICRDEQGKPSLSSGECCISISHTRGYWVVMSAECACGIDCEKVDRRTEHLAHKFLSEAEKNICESLWNENPTLLGWCTKEAVYKCMSVEGVDFLRDMVIVAGSGQRLEVIARGERLCLRWEVRGELLIVYTI